ncbi:ATP-dependent RNA helicase ddx51 [Ptychographa xylographoides]|nr:ATP-dependent RNA helicase ddx51 [Ptychographa xylographoides]
MATQFYARYQPPTVALASVSSKSQDPNSLAKKKRKRGPAPGTITENSISTAAQNSLSLKDKKNVQRPSTSLGENQDTKIVPVKRKKRATEVESSKLKDVESFDERGTDSYRKKAKKTKIELGDLDHVISLTRADSDELDEDPEVNKDTKHKRLRSKFENSGRIAVKLSEKARGPDEGQSTQDISHDIPSVEIHGLVPLPQPPQIPEDSAIGHRSVLPEWLANPLCVSSNEKIPFKDILLDVSTVATLSSKGFYNTFAIQTGVLPLLLPGPNQYDGDLCISAATGSGKTLAYILPMVESLRGKPTTRLRGLIVVPTRELVSQVRETLQLCSIGSGLRIGTAVGSKSLREEQELLITRTQKYDPKGYRNFQSKQVNMERDLMNWDDESNEVEDGFECLIDFTVDLVSSIDILICTPGRLVDHMKSTKGFTLEHVQWLIVDEADRLLDESFQQWVDLVLPAVQAEPIQDPRTKTIQELFHIHQKRQIRKIILSATISKDISKLMALQLQQPRLVVLENAQNTEVAAEHSEPPQFATTAQQTDIHLPSTLKEVAISVDSTEEKPLYLLGLLSPQDSLCHQLEKRGDPVRVTKQNESQTSSSLSSSREPDSDNSTSASSSDTNTDRHIPKSPLKEKKGRERTSAPYPIHGTLIFTNNNENALRLARLLSLLRPSLAPQIGSLTKSTATSTGRKTLAAFRNHKLSILVASDRASRGLDIQDLAQVVNYDMPTTLTSYVHRVGRTARAGRGGVATTLVVRHEARWFWNEIARSEKIGRTGKVARAGKGSDDISEEDRKAYEEALKQLGKEAQGERSQKA